MAVHYVYIIRSVATGRHYTGSTRDWQRRLEQHNAGEVRSTKAYAPWEVVYLEESPNRTGALKRERQIKRYKSGDAVKRLVRQSRPHIG